MNVIGEIGNFIIKYQEIIQAAAIVIAVIAAVMIIIKVFSNAKKKREILSQINTTVSEINTAVNHMNEKKADVIYIDSRMSPGASEAGVRSILEAEPEAVSTDAVKHETTDGEAVEPASAKESSQDAEAEEQLEPSLKYFSRDCAVSKTGKKFTLEELEAQIRE